MEKIKLSKTCRTCESNFNGKCADEGELGKYGSLIDDFNKERSCWSIGMEYYSDLMDLLPKNEREYFTRQAITPDDLIKRLLKMNLIKN
ncbi:hypothetical protein ACSU64_05475 [Bacillaceae bacterium C204]|uniref:hypothetical protein n=1 Tax=Neobacillus sp. 204 TaxID=3383351 RepID=UPI00397AD205